MKLLFEKKDRSCKVFLIKEGDNYLILKQYYTNMLKSDNQIKHIFNEKNILYYVLDNNILNCNKIIKKDKNEEGPCFYLEFINGAPLNVLLKDNYKLNYETVKYICFKVLNILKDLHSNNILYRDLKASNIILTDNYDIKLIDFGLSKFLTKDDNYLTKSICGTPHSIPPYVFDIDNNGYSFNYDLFGLGILIYEFLMGEPPFGYNITIDNIKNIYSNKKIKYKYLKEEAAKAVKYLTNNNLIYNKNTIKEVSELAFFKNIKNDPEQNGLCYYKNTITTYLNNIKCDENNKENDIFNNF